LQGAATAARKADYGFSLMVFAVFGVNVAGGVHSGVLWWLFVYPGISDPGSGGAGLDGVHPIRGNLFAYF